MQINTAMSTIILAHFTVPCASAYTLIPELSTFTQEVKTSLSLTADYVNSCVNISTSCNDMTGPITVTLEKSHRILLNAPGKARFGYAVKYTSGSGGNYPVDCELKTDSESRTIYTCPPFDTRNGTLKFNGVYLYYMGEEQFGGSVSSPPDQEGIAKLIASERLSLTTHATERTPMYYEANGIRLESYSSLTATTISTVSTRITIQVDAPGEVNMPLCVVGKPCVTAIPVQVRSNLRDHYTRIDASFVNLPTGDSGVINNDTKHTSPVITTSFYGVANYNLDTTINTLNHGENTYYIKITATLN